MHNYEKKIVAMDEIERVGEITVWERERELTTLAMNHCMKITSEVIIL